MLDVKGNSCLIGEFLCKKMWIFNLILLKQDKNPHFISFQISKTMSLKNNPLVSKTYQKFSYLCSPIQPPSRLIA